MTPIVHITDKERKLQAKLDHSRACVKQMARMNELMVSELAEARVELDRLKADADRLDWIAMHGTFGVDSVTGEVGGNGITRKASTRINIDNAMKEQS